MRKGEKDQREIINLMYSKHLVSPSYVEKELEAQGKSINAPDLLIDDLLSLDQDHFGGIDATDHCISACNINASSNVLDIGSGLGGPARYIAWRTGCCVTGVEIQKARYDFSLYITRKLNLSERVHFIYGDIYELKLPKEHYTHIISFLAILHLVKKTSFLESLRHLLRVNGQVYIEDYVRGRGYLGENKKDLLEVISCPNLLSTKGFINALNRGALRINTLSDMTPEWMRLARERCEDLKNNFLQKREIHGQLAIENAILFSNGVLRLFEMKIIKGLQIIGTNE